MTYGEWASLYWTSSRIAIGTKPNRVWAITGSEGFCQEQLSKALDCGVKDEMIILHPFTSINDTPNYALTQAGSWGASFEYPLRRNLLLD